MLENGCLGWVKSVFWDSFFHFFCGNLLKSLTGKKRTIGQHFSQIEHQHVKNESFYVDGHFPQHEAVNCFQKIFFSVTRILACWVLSSDGKKIHDRWNKVYPVHDFYFGIILLLFSVSRAVNRNFARFCPILFENCQFWAFRGYFCFIFCSFTPPPSKIIKKAERCFIWLAIWVWRLSFLTRDSIYILKGKRCIQIWFQFLKRCSEQNFLLRVHENTFG